MSARAPLVALYEDASCVVVAKPSGLLVHNTAWAGPREVSVTECARAQWGVDLVPVHRLDRGTSGVLLMARGTDAARAWQISLSSRDTIKTYLALVRGVMHHEAVVDHALRDEDGVARDARTHVIPTATCDDPRCSIVMARPFTGRTHQVRRHLKHLSHPVIGDSSWGKGALNRDYASRYGLTRLALHACSLSLRHPMTGERLSIVAPLEGSLRSALEAIVGEAMVARVSQVNPFH
jgi:tRNA pseudouridine65 synthase